MQCGDDMSKDRITFLFGASTAPYAKATDWPMEEWDGDLARMQELNFNAVRIFAAWDRIERREGEFDFSKQDKLIELAEQRGIQVILNLGGLFGNPCGCYQPRWLARNHDCFPWVRNPATDVSLPNSFDVATPNKVCPDDPIHLEKAKAFMRRTIERYAGSEAIAAWMVWNEPDRRGPCYCKHTVGLYRQWLAAKYGSLEAISEQWSSESPVEFTSWKEIPASGIPSNKSRRDWLMFNQHRLAQTMKEYDELVQACDPQGRPSTANIVYHHAAYEIDTHGPNLGIDLAQIGQALGIMGVSCYTIAHPFDTRPAYETAYKLSRLRSVSRDPQRRFLVLETEVGPYRRMITDAQRRQRFYHMVGHNAKSIVVWNYRSRLSDGQAGDFHMQKWDGSISRRGRSVGDFAGVMQANAELTSRVYPERAAAVLTLEEQQMLSYVHHGPEYVNRHESRIGAYKLLWDMNLPTDCIAENNLDEMERYNVILLPLVENISADLAAHLKRYVENGGTVIAEAPFAFKDTDGNLIYHAPGFGLDELFGGWTADREGWETASPITCPEGESKAHFFWHEFTLTGTGEALATYADGSPAVIANRYGKGRAVLAGTEVFRQYSLNPQAAMTALLQSEIRASGARPTAVIKGGVSNIEVSRLTGPGGLLVLITNHNPHEVEFAIELPDPGAWIDLETGNEHALDGTVKLAGETTLAIRKRQDRS